MGKIVGIDLGTTFSSIAHLNDLGKPDIFPVDGERIVPSAVYFESANKFHVGGIAINALTTDDGNVVRWIKKTMGSTVYDVDNSGKPVADGRVIIGKKWTPAELSSFVLKHLASNFEKIHGKIAGAVVTVPAYFDEVRRKATMDAAELAGLKVLGIVNEPTAAAIYYSSVRNIDGRNLVFDLGGGTFDITIMDVEGEEVEVISTAGDHELGGFNFDNAIKEFFTREFETAGKSIDEMTDSDLATWLLRGENAKINLSKLSSSKFSASVGNQLFSSEITRDQFVKEVAPHLSRIEMLMELALDEANVQASDIDNIILCGGSTRIPAVREKIKRVFGKEPIEVGNVDEAVSLGAAIYAGILALDQMPEEISSSAKETLGNMNVTDVCSHSYGTLALTTDEFTNQLEERNSIIIRKNSKLPVSVSKTFYTVQDGQNEIDAVITQGESLDPSSVTRILEETFTIPAGRPAGQPIEISYSYDLNMRMKCIFKDVNSGTTFERTFDMASDEEKDYDIFDDFDL